MYMYMYSIHHTTAFPNPLHPISGGIVLHSGSRLIPHNDIITDVQYITSETSDTMATIQCTSDQIPLWREHSGQTLSTTTNNTVYQIINGNTSTLVVNTNNTNNFINRRFSCNTTQYTAKVNLYIGPGGMYVSGCMHIIIIRVFIQTCTKFC